MAAAPLYLTILRQGDTMSVDLTEVDPIVRRSQITIEEGLLTEIGAELARITTLANRRALLASTRGTTSAVVPDGTSPALQRLGELIFTHLFPASARQRLASIAPTDVFLRVDDQLVHVPWELAFDGRDFLLTKFRLGRQVITHRQPSAAHPRPGMANGPLRMLIIVDPTESLEAASGEAEQLCDLLSPCSTLEVTLIGGKRLRKLDLLQALSEHDLVHYAGHACFDPVHPGRSGWVLHEAVLTASEISRLARPPLLVFSNACQAGATTRWQAESMYEGQAFGIGSAFLLAGVPNYIGTFCVIHDAHSAAFAADFYQHLLQGERLGAALLAARHTNRQKTDQGGLLWASYMHYGNPLFQLPLHPTAEDAAALDSPPPPAGDPLAVQTSTGVPTEYCTSAAPEDAPTPPEPAPDAEAPGTETPAAPSTTGLSSGRGHSGRRRYRWLIVAGAGLLAGAFLLLWRPSPPEDRWTSRVLTLALFPLERKYPPWMTAGPDELVEPWLTQGLQTDGRVKVVERVLLEKVLTELQLGTSDLVDPQAVLRVGRMLAARLLASGSIKYVRAGAQLSLRVIDTETTTIVATDAEAVETPEALDSTVQTVSHHLRQQLRQAYPLQGRITQMSPQGVLLLNIGALHGVTSGLPLQVFGSAEPLQKEHAIGQAVVTHVAADSAEAQVLQSTLPLRPGWRVREMPEP